MFVGTIIVFAISVTRLVLRTLSQLADDKRGQGTHTTEKIVGKSQVTFVNTSDKNETKSDVNLPDDAINSINDNAIECNIDKIDIIEKNIDNDAALILTPYIESGRINDARTICQVKSDIFLGVKSYSGFLTVNKTYNSNLFFWYFPIENQPVSENPWIIWLQGGPGASSMYGLFSEIGPFMEPHFLPLQRNPYSWLQNHSLVFIDNPVGAGYSFTDHEDGLARDMPTYALHLKLAVQQLLELFPELKAAPLFVAGESYGGKYAPALAMELHKAKKSGTEATEVNLQGIITGNGIVEASVFTHVPKVFYYFGLISQEDLAAIKLSMDDFEDDVKNNRNATAKSKWHEVFLRLLYMAGQSQGYNFLRDEVNFGKYEWLLERSDVKKAIHVGNIKFTSLNETVFVTLSGEFLTSARPLYEELLDHYKVLAYCGQFDLMIPCALESEQYRKWIWSQTEEFQKAVRFSFMMNMNERAGYIKSGGNLTEVMIIGAGHSAAMEKPDTLQKLISTWTHNQEVQPYFI